MSDDIGYELDQCIAKSDLDFHERAQVRGWLVEKLASLSAADHRLTELDAESTSRAVDLRCAMYLLASEPPEDDFHEAMRLIGKHCGVNVPELSDKPVSIFDLLKRPI